MTNYENKEFNNNCVALTVREEYKLTVVKNVARKTRDLAFKVIFNTVMLNLLSMFF